MNKNSIMNTQEIHEYGIHVVEKRIQEMGFNINEILTDISMNPQIIARYKGSLIFILVRTACFPRKGNLQGRNFAMQFLKYSKQLGARSYFASISIRNVNGVTDLEKSIPIKNGRFSVEFHGLIELSKILETNLSSETMHIYDDKGLISGTVERNANGKHSIRAKENSGFNAALMSLFIVFADDLSESEKQIFSRWADLPLNVWGEQHRQEFAFALMNFFIECKLEGRKLSPKIDKVMNLLKPQSIPPLRKPLSPQVKRIFTSLFISS